jgi:hypothetical protein
MCPITFDEFCGCDSVLKSVHKRHNFPAQGHRSIRSDRVQLTDQTAHIEGDRVVEQTVSVLGANQGIQSAQHLFHHQRGHRLNRQGYSQSFGCT